VGGRGAGVGVAGVAGVVEVVIAVVVVVAVAAADDGGGMDGAGHGGGFQFFLPYSYSPVLTYFQ